MSKEKAGEKDPTLIEYEKLIEDLMKENETLKSQIIDLEEQINLFKDIADTSEEVPEPKEVKKPAKLFKKSKKKEAPVTPVGKSESVKIDSQILKEAPKRATPTIIEAPSRRECPICGNTKHGFIQEVTDKTRLISDYPRMYGKKLKCGECGQEWRVVAV